MFAAAAHATGTWLVVHGDEANSAANMIKVNPEPVAINGDKRVMRVRVSRSAERTTRDGVSFRSFDSNVLFDCAQKTARFVSVDFYAQPQWRGESFKTETYLATDVRSMEFRDVQPNPRDRIIRAACSTGLPANWLGLRWTIELVATRGLFHTHAQAGVGSGLSAANTRIAA